MEEDTFSSPKSAPRTLEEHPQVVDDSDNSSTSSYEGSESEDDIPAPPPLGKNLCRKNRKRQHTFTPQVAPYPMSYDRDVLDAQNWASEANWMFSGRKTALAFANPPTKVLDLGTGNGLWVIESAETWPETHFVGFDLVDIQPDLKLLEYEELAGRITWVHGNFLEALPFGDNEFDFVHIRHIARGVPETKWDDLFAEVHRILKPGAALEVVEENLTFPRWRASSPLVPPSSAFGQASARPFLPTSAGLSVEAPPSALPAFASRHSEGQDHQRRPSHSFSSASSAHSHPYSHSQSKSQPDSPSFHRGSTDIGARASESAPPKTTSFHSHNDPTSRSHSFSDPHNSAARGSISHAIADPRDHTVLERWYTEMHDARWINLKPINILSTYISSRFRGHWASTPLGLRIPRRRRRIEPLEEVIQEEEDNTELDRSKRASTSTNARRRYSGDRPYGIHSDFITFDKDRVPVSGMYGEVPPSVVSRRQQESSTVIVRQVSGANSVAEDYIGKPGIIIDDRTMGVNLAYVVSNILGCMESMWEHVRKTEPTVTRAEFNKHVNQFRVHMRQLAGISPTVQARFDWQPPPRPKPKEEEDYMHQKNFDVELKSFREHRRWLKQEAAGGGERGENDAENDADADDETGDDRNDHEEEEPPDMIPSLGRISLEFGDGVSPFAERPDLGGGLRDEQLDDDEGILAVDHEEKQLEALLPSVQVVIEGPDKPSEADGLFDPDDLSDSTSSADSTPEFSDSEDEDDDGNYPVARSLRFFVGWKE